MTLNPTLTISIDRSSLPGSLAPLVFSAATDSVALGIVSYQPPARMTTVTYAPKSINTHGSEAIGASLEQANLAFDWMMDEATLESEVAAAYAATAAAVEQFSYAVTTAISDAAAEVWAADPGSLTPPERTYVDLANPNAWVCAVTIPVYPIPGSV